METKDLQKMNKAEVAKMIAEKKSALNVFKFGIASGKVKNVKEGKNLRKDIAQLHTIGTQLGKTK